MSRDDRQQPPPVGANVPGQPGTASLIVGIGGPHSVLRGAREDPLVVVTAAVRGEVSSEAKAAPRKYLRTAIAVARSARRGEYVVAYFSSGSFFRVDRLGAMAMRALIDGKSDLEAMDLVERQEPGAGERLKPLIDGLSVRAALTTEPPSRAAIRWQVRWLISRAIGLCMTALAPLVHIAPSACLAWIYRTLPFSPIGTRVWRSGRFTIVDNLRASGYATQSELWLRQVSRRAAACTPGDWFFMYLSICLSPDRLNRFVGRVLDSTSADSVAGRLRQEGSAVVAFLHGPLSPAVPNALRARGVQVVRTTKGDANGVNVSEKAGPLSSFFGEPADLVVDLARPEATALMLRHLDAGRTIHISLDKVASPKATAEIGFLGQRFVRNDEPAWLAVKSGRPLVFLNSYASASGLVTVEAYPTLYPDSSLAPEVAVEALSLKLYDYAESALRDHPEAWGCWIYMSRVRGDRAQVVAAVLDADQIAVVQPRFPVGH